MTKAIITLLRRFDAGPVSAQTGSVDDLAQAEGGAFAVEPLHTRTVGFDASAKIKRTEFGVRTLVPLISDDVDIIISAAFERQS